MEENNKQKKLTYEELSAYVEQTLTQAKKLYSENQMLRRALDRSDREQNLKQISLAMKCLDHTDQFSPDFIKKVTEKLEKVLCPSEEAEGEEDKEENKGKSQE